MNSKKFSLVLHLKAAGIVKTGDFVLKSGARSKIYFDFKSLISHPSLSGDICRELGKMVLALPLQQSALIAGVPVGGIAYASLISQQTNIPMILVRETTKDHGLGKQIEGDFHGRTDVILIEDVITTGGSVQKFADILESNGFKIVQIISILDREAGGVEALRTKYNVLSLFKMRNFTSNFMHPAAEELLRISRAKQSNLIVALDIPNPNDLLAMLRKICDQICAVKLHIDIVDFSVTDITEKAFIRALLELKYAHNFMIIEDRKYADIPAISIAQMDRYHVREWADMVTVHGICGPELVNAIQHTGVGVILIRELSVAGNIIDSNYSDRVVNIGVSAGKPIGYVSQSRPQIEGSEQPLIFSPGVNLDTKSDNMGQTYTANKDADFFIVGRGITQAKDVLMAAIRYRNTFYRAISKM
jgi:uridine monophosphate synthetase